MGRRRSIGGGALEAQTGDFGMNIEQRQKVMQAIRKREALLAWALKNGDKREAERLKHELLDLVETAF